MPPSVFCDLFFFAKRPSDSQPMHKQVLASLVATATSGQGFFLNRILLKFVYLLPLVFFHDFNIKNLFPKGDTILKYYQTSIQPPLDG
jgi:hypothetical protein